MTISAVQSNNETSNKIKCVSAVVAGAAAGIGARYVMPTKTEFKSFINKDNFDKFTKSSLTTRASNRSIIKYAGVGALILGGISFIANKIKNNKKENENQILDYSKLGILLDAPDYAYSIYCFGDE